MPALTSYDGGIFSGQKFYTVFAEVGLWMLAKLFFWPKKNDHSFMN